MKRNPNTTKLTKEFIESKVSQELIVSKYLGIELDIVKDCINKNTLIKSVFRDDDTNKSMGIQYNARGRLKVRDFGGFGFFEDVYGTVAYVLSAVYDRPINTNNKQDFYFVLKHIRYTFCDIIDGKVTDDNLDTVIATANTKIKSKKAIIELAPRSWNKDDIALWKSWGIDINYLNTHFIYPIDQYYINRYNNPEPKYRYTRADPAYGYLLGQNKQGISLIKVYHPLRNRNVKSKFITNCNVIEGLINLEPIRYDYILITKSTKDRLSIGNHLLKHPLYRGGTRLNVGIVNLPSENYRLKDKEYTYLINKLKDDGKLFSLLDFDATGRSGAKFMQNTYNIDYLFITRGEFGLPNYYEKDFSDLHNTYSYEEINKFIDETLSYINIKYGEEITDTEGLPIFNLPY
uniref:DNA primase n=1 Tax=Geladintestivirus 1 TaxID=3233133 RepID=A0AAU8MJY6_9CAUD